MRRKPTGSASEPSPPAARPAFRARLIPWGLAALSGLLYVAAFPGFDQFYLAFIAFVPVGLAARDASPRRALLLGGVMGLVSHLIAYTWLIHMLQVFAYLPYPVAVLGWVLVCAGQGLSYGVGLALSQWLRRRTGWPYSFTLAVGLTVMDLCYPLVFPSYIANTMAGAVWLMQTADLFGVLGITALLGAINGAVLDAAIARREGRALPVRTLATVGALTLAAVGYGAWRTAQVDAEASAAAKLKVGLVQANFGGFNNLHARQQSLIEHLRMTRELSARGLDLVVWPEGALDAQIWPTTNVRQEILGGTEQALLFGALRIEDNPATGQRLPYNAAFVADKTGQVRGSYDKTELLVFGEYIPGGDLFPKLYEWIENASHWGRGQSTAPLVLGDWKLGTFICYEDIIPRHVQKIMAPRDGARPDVMVNITNDSWYGRFKEQAEHLALARFRAVEHHRALVRSTNTGISAFVDPAGRVVSQTPMFRPATLVGEVPRMAGTTLYEIVGDVIGYVAVALLAIGFVLGRRRSKGVPSVP